MGNSIAINLRLSDYVLHNVTPRKDGVCKHTIAVPPDLAVVWTRRLVDGSWASIVATRKLHKKGDCHER